MKSTIMVKKDTKMLITAIREIIKNDFRDRLSDDTIVNVALARELERAKRAAGVVS